MSEKDIFEAIKTGDQRRARHLIETEKNTINIRNEVNLLFLLFFCSTLVIDCYLLF